MNELLQIVRRPHVTEKSTALKEADGTLCFRVQASATKVDVRRAVERIFGVKVASVRTVNVEGKRKRIRNRAGLGQRAAWKKAYVTLKPGQKAVEYFEGS